MDKPVFIVEMPELSDEAVANVHNFLWDILRSFEVQYFHQLQRYHRQLSFDDKLEDLF